MCDSASTLADPGEERSLVDDALEGVAI